MARKTSDLPAASPEPDRPVCPYHGETCTARHSSAAVTYYYCPRPECRYVQKRIRRDYAERLRRGRTPAKPKGTADGAPRDGAGS